MRATVGIAGMAVFLAVALALWVPACAGKKKPLDAFAERQKGRMNEASAYIQADFDFWASIYEPTTEDLEGLRGAWVEHGQAFPESRAFGELERELRKSSQRVVLLAMFMTSFENADPRDKALGWSLHPVPVRITELAENDVVLRTLMPVRNQWARYFLLRFAPDTWVQASTLVVSNRHSRVELKRWQLAP